MPPRDPELPEGTDHIINGAMEINGGNGGATGAGDGGSTGFVGSGTGSDTGGTSMADTQGNQGGAGLKEQLREGASSLQSQAGEKIRALAETGKDRATSALDDFSQVVSDAADSIDERLGSEYGEYARRAADAVSDFADTLRNKDVDELFEDGRNLIRRSPGVALGVAAVVGFTLVRLAKAGMNGDGGSRGEREISFEPDMDRDTGSGATTTAAAGTTAGGAGTGGSGTTASGI